MPVDRWLSIGLTFVGLVMIVIGLAADVSEQTQRSLIFLGFDCFLFSIAGLLYPKSNQELKQRTASFLLFLGLAIATFGAVSLLVFVVFGAPSPIDDVVFSTSLTLGLAAALIVPLLAKQLTLKMRTKQ